MQAREPARALARGRRLTYHWGMSLDVVDLRNFYASPLGATARRLIGARLKRRWHNVAGESLLGLGYATPYLKSFRDEALRTLAMMPATQGVVHWPPPGEPSSTALVDEYELPLPSSSMDRVMCLHLLEHAEHPAELLSRGLAGAGPGRTRAFWWFRTGAAGGRAAKRRLLAMAHPYSRPQLTHLLRESLFSPLHWSEVLYMPPSERSWILSSALLWERLGTSLSAPFAGLHLVEATKQVYSALPVRRRRRFMQMRPVLVPETSVQRR